MQEPRALAPIPGAADASELRALAPIPGVADASELRALFTRVHWLVIAQFDRALAKLGDSTTEISVSLRAALQNTASDYQSDYEYYMSQNDEGTLKVMRRFIARASANRTNEPESGFLFLPGRPDPEKEVDGV